MVKIYTDGSCSKNGSKDNFGGYGIVLTVNDKAIKVYSNGKMNTTNNEMELEAIHQGIKIAKIINQTKKQEILIYTDSAYCVNTINTWMYAWSSNNWIKKSDKKPPENLILIQKIYDIMQFERNIKIVKIKGHDGHEFNEMADSLATNATKSQQQKFIESHTKGV